MLVVIAAAVATILIVAMGSSLLVIKSEIDKRNSTPAAATALLNEALRKQSLALLRGDEKGWLAPVDNSDKALVRQYRSQYQTLHALQVVGWHQHATLMTRSGRIYRGELSIIHCFGQPSCPISQAAKAAIVRLDSMIDLRILWTVEWGRAKIKKLSASSFVRNHQPLLEDLKIRQGKRVVVAAPPSLSQYLQNAVAVADLAATRTDTLPGLPVTPERHIIILAEQDQWAQWLYNSNTQSSGFTSATYFNRISVVNLTGGWTTETERAITHEVTSGASQPPGKAGPWWLREGLAEYIAYPEGVERYVRLPSVRQFVKSGKWDGELGFDFTTEDYTINDRYEASRGISYLMIRHIAETHGEAKMLDFFVKVVEQGISEEFACQEVFQVPWTTVKAESVAYITSLTNS